MNGILIDSFFRSINGQVYLEEVRTKKGKLLYSILYYDNNEKSIHVFYDYLLKIGFEYSEEGKLKEIRFWNESQSEFINEIYFWIKF